MSGESYGKCCIMYNLNTLDGAVPGLPVNSPCTTAAAAQKNMHVEGKVKHKKKSLLNIFIGASGPERYSARTDYRWDSEIRLSLFSGTEDSSPQGTEKAPPVLVQEQQFFCMLLFG